MKFLPFKTLIEMLRFHEDEARRQHVASVDGEEIAYANYAAVTTKEAADDWKTGIRRAILCESATVVLRTACGCEQVRDLTRREELHSLLIPMMWTRSAMVVLKASTEYDPLARYFAREFKWDRCLLHENGAKVMEEVVRQ